MKWILLLWFHGAAVDTASVKSSEMEVVPVTFTSEQSCTKQLERVRVKSEWISGMCIQGDQ